VAEAVVVMATPMNKELLSGVGLLTVKRCAAPKTDRRHPDRKRSGL
jgi:hypothetical protein